MDQHNSETTPESIAQSSGFVLIYFPNYLGPSRMMEVVVSEIADVHKVRVIQLNGEIAEKFKVRIVPTLILYRDGQELERITGDRGYRELKSWLVGWLD